MSFKRKYALCQRAYAGSDHSSYRITSLHKSRKEAENSKNGYCHIIELAEECTIGDLVHLDGRKA